MSAITMYSTHTCPFCVQAENLLQSKGLSVNKIWVDQNPDEFATMLKRSARRSVPQVFIGDRHLGGFNDLLVLEQSGQLSKWLADAQPSHS
ncbi:glutaredoxin 3 [Iodobacter fluviatilis]|uniref:Glutaredoxin n=1 Tax=Iodobacter fluviatilis TaxID=537 RepID=A0A377Q7P6_9NEIS|nr:glutaredoxin 3 [Iodobacter fluviatilis]TCU89410.1 glutaredoxin 3 [Iodobacter fluviatilis]STQ90780.1 Glutaredoxin-3 [Iodobacter fluviatilis]